MNDTSQNAGTGNLVTEQVKQQAQQAVDQTMQAAGQAVDQAKGQATTALDSRKNQGADMLSETAQALRHTGEDLRQTNGMVAGVVDGAAGQVDNAAQYLRTHSVNDLMTDVEDLARRNGTIFFGGAFVLGILAARFLKSSPPRSQYSQYGGPSQYGGGSSQYRGGQYPYYSTGSYGGQYSVTDVPYPVEDVSGVPPIVNDYSPGLTGQTGGTGDLR